MSGAYGGWIVHRDGAAMTEVRRLPRILQEADPFAAGPGAVAGGAMALGRV